MGNHTYPAQTKYWFDNDSRKFVVQAIKDFDIGDEVNLTYTNNE